MERPLKKGDVVRLDFPFTGGRGSKPRPAIVLYINSAYNEVVCCVITSQVYYIQQKLKKCEYYILDPKKDFIELSSGFNCKSCAVLSSLFTFKQTDVTQICGELKAEVFEKIRTQFKNLF